MHGVTKELHRLVKASSALESPAGPEDSASQSECVYADLLTKLAESDAEQVRTRVVVDAVAGTSAGGINGICLAKALAHNRSQDELRTLWFDHGDIGGLLNAPRWVKWRAAQFAWVATRARKREPLKGDVQAQWLYDAFENMDAQQPQPAALPSLLP